MPSYDLILDSDTIAAVAAGKDEARTLIARDLLHKEDEMFHALWHYCKDDRGTPAPCSLNIDPERMGISEDFTGTVMVEFQEEAYYGCKDMNKQDDHEVEIPFNISIQNKTLTLNVSESSRVSDWHET